MPGADDLRWIKSTANDLNNLLQVISESSEALEKLVAGNPEAERYLGILKGSVERAADTTRTLVSRGGGEPAFSQKPPEIVPAPSLVSGRGFEIENPQGPR